MRRSLSLAALICGLVASIGTPAEAAPLQPVSLTDDFYASADSAPAGQPGDILNSRPMPAPFGVLGAVTQIQFRSTDSVGRAIPAVATVISPLNAAPNRPVLVYGHAVNALGLRCAPSQALYSNDPDVIIREAPALTAILAMGWTVVLPDHLGPRSAYGAARLGGQITLDSIRAAQRLESLQLADSLVTMLGYSGGGMSTAWAAALAPTYAPELNLVGAAIGGLPANLEVMAEALGHKAHPAFGLAAAAAFGLEREYGDDLPISEYLTEEGWRFRFALNNACTNEILRVGAGKSVEGLGTSFELFYSDKTRRILRENSIEFFDQAPRIPIVEWHSATDNLLPLASIDNTMARWRAAGVPVTSLPTIAPEHVSGALLGIPPAAKWLADLVAARAVTR